MPDIIAQTERVLRLHFALYPDMEPQDCAKLLYQAEFGCGHFLPDPERAKAFLLEEWQSVRHDPAHRKTDDLGRFVRVHLGPLDEAGLGALAEAFIRTAAKPVGSMRGFETRLAVLEKLTAEGLAAFTPGELILFLEKYRAAGCPAVHHSERYREKYHPAYRVVRK